LDADELVDVQVGEAFQPDGAEGRQEIVVQVVTVAGHRGRLEPACLGVQPADQIVRDGLRIVEVDTGTFALQHSGQRCAGVGAGVVAAAAHGLALAIR
jgi:hypothetical protein